MIGDSAAIAPRVQYAAFSISPFKMMRGDLPRLCLKSIMRLILGEAALSPPRLDARRGALFAYIRRRLAAEADARAIASAPTADGTPRRLHCYLRPSFHAFEADFRYLSIRRRSVWCRSILSLRSGDFVGFHRRRRRSSPPPLWLYDARRLAS